MDDDDHEVDSYSSNSSSRRSGDQPESEKDSDVGGVWIVGNVEETNKRVTHSARTVQISVMDSVEVSVMDSEIS